MHVIHAKVLTAKSSIAHVPPPHPDNPLLTRGGEEESRSQVGSRVNLAVEINGVLAGVAESPTGFEEHLVAENQTQGVTGSNGRADGVHASLRLVGKS